MKKTYNFEVKVEANQKLYFNADSAEEAEKLLEDFIKEHKKEIILSIFPKDFNFEIVDKS
jgi:hypothetical protein